MDEEKNHTFRQNPAPTKRKTSYRLKHKATTVKTLDKSCTTTVYKHNNKRYTCEENAMKKILVKALKNKFGMQKEDAVALAKTVEEIFDGKKELDDMSIDKYARALFYELQRERLLKIRRDEYKEEGKSIRKYYWSYNHDLIRQAADKKIKEEPYKIYKKIPKNAWLTHSQYN